MALTSKQQLDPVIVIETFVLGQTQNIDGRNVPPQVQMSAIRVMEVVHSGTGSPVRFAAFPIPGRTPTRLGNGGPASDLVS